MFKARLKLGHVRGVSIFAAVEANLPVFEYSPLEVKSAVTGYGRAEKPQVQQMVRALLKLNALPEPYRRFGCVGCGDLSRSYQSIQ